MMINLVHGSTDHVRLRPERACRWASTANLRLVERADVGLDAILVHDAHDDDPSLAFALARLSTDDHSPTPFGVFRKCNGPSTPVPLPIR